MVQKKQIRLIRGKLTRMRLLEMRKKNRILCGISIIAVVFLLVIGLKKIGVFFLSSDDETKDSYDLAIDVITSEIPTTIFIYGEELELRDNVQYKRITEISEDSLVSENEFSVLILSDLQGTLSVTDEEYQIIKNKLDEEAEFSFYYLGEKEFKNIEDAGIIDLNVAVGGDLCVASTVYCGDRIAWGGLYTHEDRKIAEKYNKSGRPGEFVLIHLAMCYGSNN